MENDAMQDVPLSSDIEQRLTVFREQVVELEQQSKTIQVVDDVGEQAAMIFIAGVKKVSNDLEDYRDRLVRPHNTTVQKINGSVKPISELAMKLVAAMDAKRSEYITEKERKIEEANRLAAAKAEQERREKEEKERRQREEAKRLQDEADRLERERIEREIQAEQERQALEQQRKDEEAAAEAARVAGDLAAQEDARQRAEAIKAQEEAKRKEDEEARQRSLAEQAKLEKKAIAVEAKADITAMEVDTVVPVIQFNSSIGVRTLSNGEKVGTRDVKEVTCWEDGTPVYKDPIKKKWAEFNRNSSCIPKDLLDPQYARYWTFDIAAAVGDVKRGVPVPGLSSTTRKKTVGSR